MEVDAALAVGVKYVPFTVPLLNGTVLDAVPVAFAVVDDVFEAPFVEVLWLVDDAWLVCADVLLVFGCGDAGV